MLLEKRIVLITKIPTRLLCLFMPVNAIFFETIVGRKVVTATEPPDWCFTFFFGNKHSEVCMGGRHKRIKRMHNQGHAHGLIGSAC